MEWRATRQFAGTAEGGGESIQFTEVKATHLALDISEKKLRGQYFISTLTHAKCQMFGVVTAVEAEQLAKQRQTHLGCCIVARHCYQGREPGCKSVPCGH